MQSVQFHPFIVEHIEHPGLRGICVGMLVDKAVSQDGTQILWEELCLVLWENEQLRAECPHRVFKQDLRWVGMANIAGANDTQPDNDNDDELVEAVSEVYHTIESLPIDAETKHTMLARLAEVVEIEDADTDASDTGESPESDEAGEALPV